MKYSSKDCSDRKKKLAAKIDCMANVRTTSSNDKDNALREMQDLLRSTVANFIQDIFNYDQISVSASDSRASGMGKTSAIDKELVEEDGHVSFKFSYRHYGREVHDFVITKIPAVPGSEHIQIFFRAVVEYIHLFYDDLLKGHSSSADLAEFLPHIQRAKALLFNIEITIIIQYLYWAFNHAMPGFDSYAGSGHRVRYDMDLINKAYNFAIELNTRKVENEEIYCGFIFHDNMLDIDNNSMRYVKFKNEIEFGNFSSLKNYLTTSNGQDVFFNVTDKKITHLFVTKQKVNEVVMVPTAQGKTFDSRPMILSVQGNGKIIFIEGRRSRNQLILLISNSKPLIRDAAFVERTIKAALIEIAPQEAEKIEFLSKWIISLSQKKHGTSLVFLDATEDIEKKLVKSQGISEESGEFLKDRNSRHDMFLLDSLTKPDGAIIFNSDLMPTHISTILPINTEIKPQEKSGGARHSSVSNFTDAFKCTGIVVSEDGPISIFKNGIRIIKF